MTAFALHAASSVSDRNSRRKDGTERPAQSVGDVFDFTFLSGPVEIVLGFRPGTDVLHLPRRKVLSIREEAGDLVIDCGSSGVVVLQGVAMADFLGSMDDLAAA